MQSFQFYNPTKILCGEGIFDNLPNTISNTYKNIFIVTDSNILNILGGKDKLEFMFNKENLNVSIYDGIKPDPTYDDINNVAEIFKTISTIKKFKTNFKDQFNELIKLITNSENEEKKEN